MTAPWFPMVHILQEVLEQLTESLRKAVVVFWGPVSVEEWFVWGKVLYSNLGWPGSYCVFQMDFSLLQSCSLSLLTTEISGMSYSFWLFFVLKFGFEFIFLLKKILVMICYQITFIFPSNLQPKTFRRVFNTWAEGQPPPTQEILWYC